MTPEEENIKEETEEKQEETPATNEDEVLEKELENEERLPFPNARVVAIMKEALDKDKMIRARVKKEMNEWLGKMCKRVAKDMNKSPYTVIEAGDLHQAIRKYETLEQIAKEKERLVSAMNRVIQDAQMLISDIERSWEVEE